MREMRRLFALAGTLTAALVVTTEAHADDDWAFLPVFRIALGPAIHVAPEREKHVELGLDLTAGFAAMPTESFAGPIVNPELGYSFDSLGIHAFNLTCGVGFGTPLAALLYHPRLIVGTLDGEAAVGMRNSLTFHALADLGSIEIGHQFVSIDGELHHDIRVMFGVNPLGFVYIVSAATDFLR